ncbi:hypothetical protein [Rhizobium sp. 1399]|uniref:hypothetical protein n=1 Tax=unclassified Rhizobium TaxID=2613769 RepID=UPI002861091C|nr:hypothetical protein [Rhizobium sp. 1399]MDR6667237.1 hypothetical protein [Rhizobium sp. 1399]
MPEAVASNSIPASEGQPEELTALLNLTATMAFALVDRMITARLAGTKPETAAPSGKVTIWPDLFQRIGKIVDDVYADHRLSVPEPGNANPTSQYFHMVIRKLEGSRDPFEAGSLLPWIEMKIRADAAKLAAQPIEANEDGSLRDRIIADNIAAGISSADIAQAMNIKRSTVERIIGRLEGRDRDSRKAG